MGTRLLQWLLEDPRLAGFLLGVAEGFFLVSIITGEPVL